MSSNFKLFFSIVTLGAIMFSGCSNEDELPIENISIVEEGNVNPTQKAESNQPTAILGSGGSMSSILSQTFTNIVDVAKARHIIVACSDLDTYKEDLQTAYAKGSVITVTDADVAKLDEWCQANGMVYAGDPTASSSYALVSFNRKASSMSIHKRYQGEDIEEEEVPLVIFTGWLDKLLSPNLKGPDLRSRDIKKRFTPQHVSHVFSFDLPREILDKTNWVVPEEASLSTTAEFNCDIYPLHSFADNASFSGDIYAVEAEITLHNGNLYNGRWQYNRGNHLYEVCGFYLGECWTRARLMEKDGSEMKGVANAKLALNPAPAPTDPSTPYQSGFEWSFDGWLTGGNGLESATPTPLQEGGWTWNNAKENEAIEGLEIKTDDPSRPHWGLVFCNLPYNVRIPITEGAIGDLTFRCSWIWEVPQAADDSTDRYYMSMDLFPRYLWHWSLMPQNEITIDYIFPRGENTHTFMLIPPSRKEGQRI